MALQNRPTQSAVIGWNGGNATFSQYACPGGLVCVGRDNYNAQVFRNISAAGGTVLVYLDAVIDNPYGRYHQKLYPGLGGRPRPQRAGQGTSEPTSGATWPPSGSDPPCN